MMKIWISLFAVFCFVGIARAQAPQEYPDVPLDNPAYADIYFLYDRAPLDERRVMTRPEFAVAIVRALGFSSILDEKTKPSHSDYKALFNNAMRGKSPEKMLALARLVEQFKPELQLGISDEQIKFAQSELDFRIKLDSVVSPDSSTYNDFFRIIQQDLVPELPRGMYYNLYFSRYEVAIAVARILSNIYEQNDPHSDHFQGQENSRVDKNYREIFEKHPEVAESFLRLLKEFAPEVAALGFTKMQIKFAQIKFAQIELSAGRVSTLRNSSQSTPGPKPPIAAPFQDVPKTHWAFNAVERLRQSGIVIGNPNKSFAQ